MAYQRSKTTAAERDVAVAVREKSNCVETFAWSLDHHHLVLKILSAFLRMRNFRKGLLSASLTQTTTVGRTVPKISHI